MSIDAKNIYSCDRERQVHVGVVDVDTVVLMLMHFSLRQLRHLRQLRQLRQYFH